MATALNVNSFIGLVQKSKLVPAKQLDETVQDLAAEGVELDTPRKVADALIERELLTRWQADHLLQGKHKGFFLGSYRFLKLLGKGGMGAVYLAQHEMMRRRCAIKVLPSKLIDTETSLLERFYLEAQAVAALDHPNIVRAYDVNKEIQGRHEIHYLVMEYVEGDDLQNTVGRRGQGLDYVEVADFMRQAARGLAHAHESGLIHRDIKPANLLVDKKGVVRILDLGLARFFDDPEKSGLTAAYGEAMLGTADYLSPEQALSSHNVDHRTDIYSLGCTCYFLLTGQPPFPEGSVAQRLMSHQVKSPVPIDKFRPDVPAALVTIVDRMIAKKPADRFQTADEVSEALTTWLVENADEGWKQQHRDLFGEGSGVRTGAAATAKKTARREPSEDELGLAPLEDDERGTDSGAEKVVPAAAPAPQPAPDAQQEPAAQRPRHSVAALAPPEPFVDPLDELPADPLLASDSSNSTLSLSGSTTQISGSGAYPTAPGGGQSKSSDDRQVLRLILIGLGVSVPLAVAVAFSGLLLRPHTAAQPSLASANGAAQVPDEDPAAPPDEPDPSVTPPEQPVEDVSGEPTDAPVIEAADEGPGPQQPPTQPQIQPPTEPATQLPGQLTAEPATVPGTPETSGPPAATQSPDEPDPEPTSVTPVTPEQPAAPPGAPGVGGESPAAETPPKPELTDAQRQELLAEIRQVFVSLDGERRPNSNLDFLLLRSAAEALFKAGVEPMAKKSEETEAILSVGLNVAKDEPFLVLTVIGELKCRAGDEFVTTWTDREEIGRIAPQMIDKRGNLAQQALLVTRPKIEGFCRRRLIGAYEAAVAAMKSDN